ncbi:UNVERIFIED_CONTAM: hypothetical protein FKN15_045704 [Acipenser sinensis]
MVVVNLNDELSSGPSILTSNPFKSAASFHTLSLLGANLPTDYGYLQTGKYKDFMSLI